MRLDLGLRFVANLQEDFFDGFLVLMSRLRSSSHMVNVENSELYKLTLSIEKLSSDGRDYPWS